MWQTSVTGTVYVTVGSGWSASGRPIMVSFCYLQSVKLVWVLLNCASGQLMAGEKSRMFVDRKSERLGG